VLDFRERKSGDRFPPAEEDVWLERAQPSPVVFPPEEVIKGGSPPPKRGGAFRPSKGEHPSTFAAGITPFFVRNLGKKRGPLSKRPRGFPKGGIGGRLGTPPHIWNFYPWKMLKFKELVKLPW